ncbi:MAG: hypothetical protein V4604_06325 [Bacteroidota bacterium]
MFNLFKKSKKEDSNQPNLLHSFDLDYYDVMIAEQRDFYGELLGLLLLLFKKGGNTFWENWIAEDIKLWNEEKNTEHHISCFGGAGTINDTSIGPWKTIEGVWNDEIFALIKSYSYSFASKKGKQDSIFLLNDSLIQGHFQLSGHKCNKCEKLVTSNFTLERAIALYALPQIFKQEFEKEELNNLLEKSFCTNHEYSQQIRSAFIEALKQAQISIYVITEVSDDSCDCKANNYDINNWKILFNQSQLKFQFIDLGSTPDVCI